MTAAKWGAVLGLGIFYGILSAYLWDAQGAGRIVAALLWATAAIIITAIIIHKSEA